MKKSEMYRAAQLAVLRASFLPENEKLEIIRELMDRESYAQILEKQEEEKGAHGNG